jgi:hypothetical protein
MMTAMPRVRLFHWNGDEAAEFIASLQAAGHKVDYDEQVVPGMFREIRNSPPEAFVIFLARLPSHGREVATALRGFKATRNVPIVFVDGVSEKVEVIRKLLPDAVYTSRERLGPALRKALAHPPTAPVVPTQMMDRYAARTAAQKLGIAEGASVALLEPPRDYSQVLGQIPKGVNFVEGGGPGCGVTLWFVRDAETYQSGLRRVRALAGRTKLWILWPKRRTREPAPTISEQIVRDAALALGLVDYKICSVNERWSALAFARKKA